MSPRHDPLTNINLESAIDDALALLWGAYAFACRRKERPEECALEWSLLHRLGVRKEVIARASARGYIRCEPSC